DQMSYYLKKVDLDTASYSPFGNAEELLAQLISLGYLERRLLQSAGANAAPGPRPSGVEEGRREYEYRWGPRARAEVTQDAIVAIITEVSVPVALRRHVPHGYSPSVQIFGEDGGANMKDRILRAADVMADES